MAARTQDGSSDRAKRVRFADPEEAIPKPRGEEEEEEEEEAPSAEAKPRESRDVDWRDVSGEAYEDEEELDRLADEEGVEIEPFNLNAEAKLGKFDESGSFTWTRRDLEEEGDEQWLEQIQGQIAKPPRRRNNETSKPRKSEGEYIALLVSVMTPEETPTRTIQRVKHDTKAVELLAEACNGLLGAGWLHIYSTKRSELEKKLLNIQWIYRIEGETEEFGPFRGLDMQDWRREGFFLEDSEQRCQVRMIGEDNWIPAWQVKNFLVPLQVDQ